MARAVTAPGGVIRVSIQGHGRLAFDATAPNGKDFGSTSEVVGLNPDTPGEPNIVLRNVSLGLTGFTHIKVVFRAVDSESNYIFKTVIVEYDDATDDYGLGLESEVLGDLAGASSPMYILAALDLTDPGDPLEGRPLLGYRSLEYEDVTPPPTPVDVTLTTSPAWGAGVITEGGALPNKIVGIYTGEPIFQAYRYETADGEPFTTNVVDVTSSTSNGTVCPADTGGKWIRFVEIVTGEGIATTLESPCAPRQIQEAPITPPPQPTSAQWELGPSILEPAIAADAFYAQYVAVLNTIDFDSVQITTAQDGLTDAEIQAAGQWEATTFSTAVGNRDRFTLNSQLHNGIDFKYFSFTLRPADVARSQRIKIRLGKEGVYGPSSTVKTLVAPSQPGTYVNWIPLIGRTQEQANIPSAGGNGRQFFRSWGYAPLDNPNKIIGSRDVGLTLRTRDFGATWENPADRGLLGIRSTQGIACDPYNSEYVLTMGSGSFLRPTAGNNNGWETWQGIYRSTNWGDDWTLVQQLSDIAGSGENTSGTQPSARFNQQTLVADPTTGSANAAGATGRTWYAMIRVVPRNSPAQTGRFMRSTDGGQNWHNSSGAWAGASLPVATYTDRLYSVQRGPDGAYYMNTGNGLYKSTDNCQSWTKFSNLTGDINDCDIKTVTASGGFIRVAVENVGIKESAGTGTGTTWSTIKSGYRAHTVCTSPHDPDIIIISGEKAGGGDPREPAQRTIDGGSNWHNLKHVILPGDASGFASLVFDNHAKFIWHGTDENRVFVARYQHLGTMFNAASEETTNQSDADYPATVWASLGCDEEHMHWWDFDPGGDGDEACMMSWQDRLTGFTVNDWDWATGSTNDDDKADIASFLNVTGHIGAGRACLILRSPDGTDRALFASHGTGTKRCPIRYTGTAANPVATATAYNIGGTANGALYGIHVVGHNEVGFMGRYGFSIANGGAVTGPTDHTYEVVGCDNAARIYGVSKGNGAQIKRKAYNGANGTWANWNSVNAQNKIVTANGAVDFRPIDSDYRMAFDPGHAGRCVFAADDGRAYRLVGETSPVVAEIFDFRDHDGGITPPEYQLSSITLDPVNSGVAYLTAGVFGMPQQVWKITNVWGTATTAVASITRSSNTATVTTATAHGYTTGQSVTIAGATQAAYNGTFTITVTGDTTFTYAVAGTPATPATGTITATVAATVTITDLTLNCPRGISNVQCHPRHGTPRVSQLTGGSRIYPAHGLTATTDTFYRDVLARLNETQG